MPSPLKDAEVGWKFHLGNVLYIKVMTRNLYVISCTTVSAKYINISIFEHTYTGKKSKIFCIKCFTSKLQTPSNQEYSAGFIRGIVPWIISNPLCVAISQLPMYDLRSASLFMFDPSPPPLLSKVVLVGGSWPNPNPYHHHHSLLARAVVVGVGIVARGGGKGQGMVCQGGGGGSFEVCMWLFHILI